MKKSSENQENVEGIKESSITEEELRNLIKNNQNEDQTLEYKLKPNFNEIKEVTEHIKERMHFKILTTIYAFANTEGGDLYVGIGEKNISESGKECKKEKIVVGVDECDEKTIKRILEQVTPKITKEGEMIQLKEEKRHVIKISVDKLNLFEKPQLLDGIAYYRDGDQTKTVKSFEDAPKIYQKELYYGFLLKGAERNLKQIKDERNSSVVNSFIEGLKYHINEFVRKNKIADHELVSNAEKQLEFIKGELMKKNTQRSNLFKGVSSDEIQYTNINTHISDFINTYKQIIQSEV